MEKPLPVAPLVGLRLRRALLTVLVLVAASAILFRASKGWQREVRLATETSPPDDPRAGYAGPFLNVRPGVEYVGDVACARCHEDKAESYRRHPMGRSLMPVVAQPSLRNDLASVRNSFEAFGFQLRVERQGDRVWHRLERYGERAQPAAAFAMEVHYVLGSGARGHSYLTNRDGYLFQTPISWYAEKGAWDLSPGFKDEWRTGRPISVECLFCHGNEARAVPHTLNQYELPLFRGHAIGCERCHGPGAIHVQMRDRDEPVPGAVDYSIVNPRRLAGELREAVCEQCHLTGKARILRRGRGLFDFRPGLPLHLFWSVFVPANELPGSRAAVSHVEEMHASRCFQHSAGRMGCITCHDPHERPSAANRSVHYRQRCLQCHQDDRGCSMPAPTRQLKSSTDNCIDCHMLRNNSSDIPHTAVTAHRILRRPVANEEKPQNRSLPAVPLKHFHRDSLASDDQEAARDLGLALTDVLVQLAQLPRRGRSVAGAPLFAHTHALVDRALVNAPDDVMSLEARAKLLTLEGQMSKALAVCESALAVAPRCESVLDQASWLALHLGQPEAAATYMERAVAVNPWIPHYRQRFAQLLAQQGDWSKVVEQAQAWVRLDPLSPEARMLLVDGYCRTGQMDHARAEFTQVEALRPPNLAEMRRRFLQRVR